MAKRLKKRFPQLKICLLLDSLYAPGPVIDIAEEYGWKYITVFKRGFMPERYDEFLSLKKLCPENEILMVKSYLVKIYNNLPIL